MQGRESYGIRVVMEVGHTSLGLCGVMSQEAPLVASRLLLAASRSAALRGDVRADRAWPPLRSKYGCLCGATASTAGARGGVSVVG